MHADREAVVRALASVIFRSTSFDTKQVQELLKQDPDFAADVARQLDVIAENRAKSGFFSTRLRLVDLQQNGIPDLEVAGLGSLYEIVEQGRHKLLNRSQIERFCWAGHDALGASKANALGLALKSDSAKPLQEAE